MADEKDLITLNTPMDELEQKLLSEDNVDQLENIINLFNLNIKKKDIVRTNKLSDLQDKVTNQIEERIEKRAGEFSNKDLLDTFKVIQDVISKSDNSLDDIDKPAIQITQNQVNVNMEEKTLSRESREKVADAVRAILARSAIPQQPSLDVEEVEVIDQEDTEDE